MEINERIIQVLAQRLAQAEANLAQAIALLEAAQERERVLQKRLDELTKEGACPPTEAG
ncbi:hypothetical protein Mesil_1932 [Allomeiothermus silvanus DSM 9946]|uniref:Uncharacterized protein n=1 Tax=Allomeiothermus silvanus (strain ATCC 700542 / DSM 9946 / NBRC 106475 / NCIMB 13440 / VI-R2) TaxID=526227 RepID=D7BGJ1_ALLS1|nr:hypothetical protein [Allomeiothermus silvanus]ADH63807.1 hypothetical protein Mesil_1932 [Allomeiothermus silvanus DSM 9946]